MDIVSVAVLAFFGACAAGGLVGWLVGYFSRFEIGLGTGLLVPGVVALGFALHCLGEYQEFSAPGPHRVEGEIISIEEIPIAGGTQPAPKVRFSTAAGTTHEV